MVDYGGLAVRIAAAAGQVAIRTAALDGLEPEPEPGGVALEELLEATEACARRLERRIGALE